MRAIQDGWRHIRLPVSATLTIAIATLMVITAVGVMAAPTAQADPVASGIVTLVTSVAPDSFWIAVDHGPLLASTDGGSTWAPQNLPASGGVMQLTFTNARYGWALLYTYGTLYRTSDGGVHWVKVRGQ
jgi:hypothetical protein